jgi:branched-chain amino acid transport system permease protein
VDEFLRLTILGLATASIFALAASGLVLTYTTTGVFNFAHGAVGMLGAFA